ncbi:piggyBac transposable element-derived protein 4-like [Hyperolius riggenbachi]|uniref:piggyBac transposable element-derived protein 4-like n=1 Tax=Hyperolius riggenbachi TaxID=752182 RepID=UPI0035A2D12E
MASSSRRRLTMEVLAELEDSDLQSLVDSSNRDAPGDLSSDPDSDSDSITSEVSDVWVWCPIDLSQAPPPHPRFPFTGEPGLKKECECDPLAYLQLFFSEAVIERIEEETNRYATQQLAIPQGTFSRSRTWEPVTAADIWLFLGLIILQGVVGKPLQKWYWSTNKIIATPFFGTVMFGFSEFGVATSSVLSLLEPLLDKGYCLTTDHFYTSPELSEILIKHKTDTYGTVRANRREMPSAFAKQKLKTGDIAAWQKGKTLALRWRDKKDVCLLSTVHDTSTVPTRTRGGKDIVKPQVVVDYNHTMGGVDKADQAVTFYPAVRKQQKKYYKKIFRHPLEQSIWNAYTLHKQGSDRPVTHADFIWKLCECICLRYQTASDARVGRHASYVVNPERLTGRHFMEYIPPTPKKNAPTRTCHVCCSKSDEKGKRIRKESRFYSPDCDVALCAIPCFKIYHTREVY